MLAAIIFDSHFWQFSYVLEFRRISRLEIFKRMERKKLSLITHVQTHERKKEDEEKMKEKKIKGLSIGHSLLNKMK